MKTKKPIKVLKPIFNNFFSSSCRVLPSLSFPHPCEFLILLHICTFISAHSYLHIHTYLCEFSSSISHHTYMHIHTITAPFPSTHPLPCTSHFSSNLCHISPTPQCYHLNHSSDPIKYGKPYTKHTCTNRSCNKKCNHTIKQNLHIQTNISQT